MEKKKGVSCPVLSFSSRRKDITSTCFESNQNFDKINSDCLELISVDEGFLRKEVHRTVDVVNLSQFAASFDEVPKHSFV